jgi:putative sporulation protein YtaF
MPSLHLVTIVGLSVSSNLDNVGVGVSYGLRNINVPFGSNLLIAGVTASGTLLSIVLGQAIYRGLSPPLTAVLGGGLIIAAGIWVLAQEALMRRGRERPDDRRPRADTARSRWGFRQIITILNHPLLADQDFSGHIDPREATALALGLTLNNIPNGLGAGLLGLNAWLTTSAVFLLSIITIWVGISGGHFGYRRLGRSTGLIGGWLLIVIGMYEVVFQ